MLRRHSGIEVLLLADTYGESTLTFRAQDMSNGDLTAELGQAREQISVLQRRLESLEQKVQGMPDTALLDPSFLRRAFAVTGHNLVGSFVFGVLLGLLFVLLAQS